MVDKVDPVTDDTSNDLSCGQGAATLTATQMASANPGDVMSFYWINGDGGLWVHLMYVFLRVS